MKRKSPVDKLAKRNKEKISDNNHLPNSIEECRKLINELKVRQIELELKNRELQKALNTREISEFGYDFLDNEAGEGRLHESRRITISENEDPSIIRDITLRKLNEQYSAIHYNLGFALANTTSVEQALSCVLDSAFEVEGIHAVGVSLINERTGTLELIVYEGVSSEFIDSVRSYIIGNVHISMIQKGKPLYGFSNEIFEYPMLFVREELIQVGVIPIKYEGKVIGSVNIASRATERLKYESKIALDIIAAQIGGTLSRIKSDNELKLRQNNFQLLFNTINDFMFILDIDGKIIIANPVIEQSLGYTQEELREMSILEVHPPERRDEVVSIFNEIMKGRLSVCSIPLYKKNGEFISVETKAVSGLWDGKDALYCISRDIRERQLAESKLKMQSSAFEAFTLAIIITDINGIIQWANSSFSKLSGYPLSEIIGKNPNQIVKSGLQDRNFYETLWNTILDGKVWSGEMINRRKDGSLFPEDLTITPVMDVNGNITNFIAIKIDIAKRKKMELELQKSEERWHFAIEGSGYGAWDLNMTTKEVFFSDQWKIMLGYSVHEIENKFEEWERLVHPDDFKLCPAESNRHFNGETEFYANEYRMLCKDGKYKWILGRGKLIEWTPDGKPSRIIGTHKDITNSKLLEEQLRKSIEKEKELNDLKSRFVATTSHEFRTPLASILMISDTLISHLQKMNATQVLARLAKIKGHVLHLTDIVNNVLQLSKMQEGKIGFKPKKENMIAMCLSIVEEFSSVKLVKGHIIFKSPFDALIAKVDDRLIIQAVNNLISNAIKYTLEDPSVIIELKLENEELILRIQDNGIGIPEEDIKYLFTPFFRAGNVSTIQGTGLGLSIVREAVLIHGGRVSCSNNTDKGATFTLHFPIDLISTFRYTPND